MCHPRIPALLSLALAVTACASPAPRNPLLDPQLLPPTEFRAAVTSESTLNILPLSDERGLGAGGRTEAERSLSIAAVDLVRGFLEREIERAGSLAGVSSDRKTRADLEMEVGLLAFAGRAEGPLAAPIGSAEVVLQVRIDRVADQTTLLKRRYQHRVEEQALPLASPDPLALACSALAAAVNELLIDLDRLDAGAAAE